MTVGKYSQFLETKTIKVTPVGIEIDPKDVHPMLYPFQRDLTLWALRKGHSALFADTGLGKTICQLEWARLLDVNTLIIAPLSVARQTIREAKRLNMTVTYAKAQKDLVGPINITNYERIGDFDFSTFDAVVLDESSILKSFSGKTRRLLIDLCRNIKYRLCCTATPAPNDYIELGNHAEFLGICSRAEMLATFFINANKEHTFFVGDRAYRKKGSNKAGQEWRLKHHAEQPFFQWLSSWSMALIKPSDLGYSNDGYILPPLNIHTHFIRADYTPDDQLFFTHLKGLANQADVRRKTIPQRMDKLAKLIGHGDKQWIVWVGMDSESHAVASSIEDAIEVKGSQTPDYKAQAFEEFQDGKHRVLVTKGRIGGYGMNFQNAHKMAFFGLSHSWELLYQCIRREWRYLQAHKVDVHIIMSDVEEGIYQNVMRKDAQARRLREELINSMGSHERGELTMKPNLQYDYTEDTVRGHDWTLMLGDSCKRLKELESDSIGLSVYSPPFADLYTYTASPKDLGNSRTWDEFFEHFGFIIEEVLRVTEPGRLTCVHTSDIPSLKQSDGVIGVKDFPGAVIRAYQEAGWIFHGRAYIAKNPQAQAIRTHSKALLFIQLRRDSAESRPALVDQILLFKKPGDNEVPVLPVENGELDNETWISWANGIWTGISETETLQYHQARENDDEKHICPLQLETIERCIKLYSNPGEVVLSPFAGIGSETYQAVMFGRKAIGIELKKTYFDIAVKNMKEVESMNHQVDLFSWAEANVG